MSPSAAGARIVPPRALGRVVPDGAAGRLEGAALLAGRQYDFVGEAFCSLADIELVAAGTPVRDRSLGAAAGVLALLEHAERVTLYRQSDVPQLAQLACVLAAAVAPAEPVLPRLLAAADILGLEAGEVMAGRDRTAVDAARDVARAWNARFPGRWLPEPRPAGPLPAADGDADAAEAVVARRAAWTARPDDLEDVLLAGARRSREEMARTLEELREQIGLGRHVRRW